MNLHAKFEVFSIILTSFRQGVSFTRPTSKRTPKKPTQIRVNPLTVYAKTLHVRCLNESEYAWVQIVPNNVLCHHNIHLMGYFEFLYGSRVICLPLNIPENCIDHISWKSQERQRLIAFILVNTIQYPRISIYHSKRRGPPAFFHSDTNPILSHFLSILLTNPMFWL